MRDVNEPFPVTDALLRRLRVQPLCKADIIRDPLWRVPTIGVCSNRMRLLLNKLTKVPFAKQAGSVVFSWRQPVSKAVLKAFKPAQLDLLYASEPQLTSYFAVGAPAMLLDNLNPSRGLAN